MSAFRSHRIRGRFLLLFGACLAWQIWRLLLTPHGLASTWTRGDDLIAVTAGGAGLTQEFHMAADGFDGLWVRAAPRQRRDAAATGEVVVTLAHVSGGVTGPLLWRQVVDAASIDTGRPVHLSFPQIRASRGVTYRVGLRHVVNSGDNPLRLLARRTDEHRNARFDVDGTEQWGDLMFEASSRRATLPYWKHEVLRPWPTWMQSWWTIGSVLLLFNLLLARACHAAVAPRPPGAPFVTSSAAAPGMAGRAALLTIGLVVTAGLAVALWPVPTVRVIQLEQHLPDAVIETTWPSMHAAVEAQPVAINGVALDAIVALPTTRMAWTLDVPGGALLLGGAAMRQDVWDKESDGANLKVTVVDRNGTPHEVAKYTLVPYLVEEHRKVHPLRVSLDPWAGQTITVVFESDPERWGNAVNDVPLWVDPRIEWPRGTAWGETRVHRRTGA